MPHPTHKFKLLLRREFWEHKGGFLWAPLVAGGIFLLLSLMFVGVGEIAARRVHGNFQVANHGGHDMDLGALISRMDSGQMHDLGKFVDALSLVAMSWPFIVLAFVVFFYCLGALYDDRRDRSVLFWKSLPLSDGETVFSKAASALLIAPAIAIATAIVTMIAFLVVASGVVLIHGHNPFTWVWTPGNPLTVAGQVIAVIPVYALWALPTAGWLLLCSAWAKSKPFLWAIMIPLFAGIFVWWFDLMNLFDLNTAWFWKNIVGRALLSVAPGSWLGAADMHDNLEGLDAFGAVIAVRTTYSVLATPQLWIGAVAGVAMIIGAIRLRRWRDDN
jgi:ABC-2 type transport system permease protein